MQFKQFTILVTMLSLVMAGSVAAASAAPLDGEPSSIEMGDNLVFDWCRLVRAHSRT